MISGSHSGLPPSYTSTVWVVWVTISGDVCAQVIYNLARQDGFFAWAPSCLWKLLSNSKMLNLWEQWGEWLSNISGSSTVLVESITASLLHLRACIPTIRGMCMQLAAVKVTHGNNTMTAHGQKMKLVRYSEFLAYAIIRKSKMERREKNILMRKKRTQGRITTVVRCSCVSGDFFLFREKNLFHLKEWHFHGNCDDVCHKKRRK